MALTARANYRSQPGGKLASIPVAPAVIIYDGALVQLINGGTNDGRATNWEDALTGTSNEFFLGIAQVTDQIGATVAGGESLTGDTAGSIEVSVDISGVRLKGVSVVGASAVNVGNLVYSADENTFSMTATPGANPIGWLIRFVTGTTADVQLFSAEAYRAHRAT